MWYKLGLSGRHLNLKYSSIRTCSGHGDLNTRVGLLNDHIVQDTIPNNVPCSLYCVNEVLPRISQDKSVNMHGRQLVDICVNTGLQIVNGRVGADRGIGSFTCFTDN